jgi:hypothetical protein
VIGKIGNHPISFGPQSISQVYGPPPSFSIGLLKPPAHLAFRPILIRRPVLHLPPSCVADTRTPPVSPFFPPPFLLSLLYPVTLPWGRAAGAASLRRPPWPPPPVVLACADSRYAPPASHLHRSLSRRETLAAPYKGHHQPTFPVPPPPLGELLPSPNPLLLPV